MAFPQFWSDFSYSLFPFRLHFSLLYPICSRFRTWFLPPPINKGRSPPSPPRRHPFPGDLRDLSFLSVPGGSFSGTTGRCTFTTRERTGNIHLSQGLVYRALAGTVFFKDYSYPALWQGPLACSKSFGEVKKILVNLTPNHLSASNVVVLSSPLSLFSPRKQGHPLYP